MRLHVYPTKLLNSDWYQAIQSKHNDIALPLMLSLLDLRIELGAGYEWVSCMKLAIQQLSIIPRKDFLIKKFRLLLH